MDRQTPRVVRVLRRGALVGVGLGCIGLGAALVWLIVRPDVLWSVATGELLIVVGLIVLPVLTAWAMRADARTGRRCRAMEKSKRRAANGGSGSLLQVDGHHDIDEIGT